MHRGLSCKNIFFLCVADRYVRVERFNIWMASESWMISGPLKRDKLCNAIRTRDGLQFCFVLIFAKGATPTIGSTCQMWFKAFFVISSGSTLSAVNLFR